jgi:hypothetical protein
MKIFLKRIQGTNQTDSCRTHQGGEEDPKAKIQGKKEV